MRATARLSKQGNERSFAAPRPAKHARREFSHNAAQRRAPMSWPCDNAQPRARAPLPTFRPSAPTRPPPACSDKPTRQARDDHGGSTFGRARRSRRRLHPQLLLACRNRRRSITSTSRGGHHLGQPAQPPARARPAARLRLITCTTRICCNGFGTVSDDRACRLSRHAVRPHNRPYAVPVCSRRTAPARGGCAHARRKLALQETA